MSKRFAADNLFGAEMVIDEKFLEDYAGDLLKAYYKSAVSSLSSLGFVIQRELKHKLRQRKFRKLSPYRRYRVIENGAAGGDAARGASRVGGKLANLIRYNHKSGSPKLEMGFVDANARRLAIGFQEGEEITVTDTMRKNINRLASREARRKGKRGNPLTMRFHHVGKETKTFKKPARPFMKPAYAKIKPRLAEILTVNILRREKLISRDLKDRYDKSIKGFASDATISTKVPAAGQLFTSKLNRRQINGKLL